MSESPLSTSVLKILGCLISLPVPIPFSIYNGGRMFTRFDRLREGDEILEVGLSRSWTTSDFKMSHRTPAVILRQPVNAKLNHKIDTGKPINKQLFYADIIMRVKYCKERQGRVRLNVCWKLRKVYFINSSGFVIQVLCSLSKIWLLIYGFILFSINDVCIPKVL